MAILTSDNLYTALSASQRRPVIKASLSTTLGRTTSLWTAGGFPSAGVAPAATANAIPNSTTLGALPFTNPTGGPLSYLAAAMGFSSSTAGTLIVYDRVLHSAGLNGTVITAQSTTGSTADRGDHIGNQLFIEGYTALGSTATNVVASYTNAAGVAGRTTVSQPLFASFPVAAMQGLPLQAGDTGVRSVESVTLSASTLTAGSFGVTVVRELARVPIVTANIPAMLDALALGMPVFADNACLSFAFVSTSGVTGAVQGLISIAQG